MPHTHRHTRTHTHAATHPQTVKTYPSQIKWERMSYGWQVTLSHGVLQPSHHAAAFTTCNIKCCSTL